MHQSVCCESNQNLTQKSLVMESTEPMFFFAKSSFDITLNDAGVDFQNDMCPNLQPFSLVF